MALKNPFQNCRCVTCRIIRVDCLRAHSHTAWVSVVHNISLALRSISRICADCRCGCCATSSPTTTTQLSGGFGADGVRAGLEGRKEGRRGGRKDGSNMCSVMCAVIDMLTSSSQAAASSPASPLWLAFAGVGRCPWFCRWRRSLVYGLKTCPCQFRFQERKRNHKSWNCSDKGCELNATCPRCKALLYSRVCMDMWYYIM